MIDKFFEMLNLISYEVMILFIVFFVISFFWKKIYGILSLKAYQSKQRLHQDEIPRIGGILIYIFLIYIALFSFESHLLNIILISAIPILIVGAKEDFFQNTSPKLRLIIMILSASMFIYLLPTKLPEIDFPLINTLLSITLFKEIFFIFSILVVINGNNLIDGINGSMALTNIFQLSALGLLAFVANDVDLVQLCIILIIPLIVFLIFNFPLGKVFSGDGGAYFYGFSISSCTIFLFGKHDHFLSWIAVLILIYPSTELLFSILRKKLFENHSPFSSDAKHLHSLIFRFLNKKIKKINNSFATIYLLPFILSPFLGYIFIDNILIIIASIFVIPFIYMLMYSYFLNLLKK